MLKVKFSGYDCDVQFARYANGNIAIQLVGSEGTEFEGEPIAVASVNGDRITKPGIVGIKTWSENQGIVPALVEGGVIEEELQFLEPTGFVAIEYYRLTQAAIEEMQQEVNDQ